MVSPRGRRDVEDETLKIKNPRAMTHGSPERFLSEEGSHR